MSNQSDIELDNQRQAKPINQAPQSSWWSCCCSTPLDISDHISCDGKDAPHTPSLVTQVQQGQKQAPVQYTQPPVETYDDSKLLPPIRPEHVNKKCLILDLDETLVHSSFTPVPNADFVITLDLNGTIHRVYVRKRPGVDEFLDFCGKHFEVSMFTASLSKYADPLLDRLDPQGNVTYRLFREHCTHYHGNYVKDLSRMGRPLKDCIIVDNSPFSYMFQRDYSIPVISWYQDKSDKQLYELIPFLQKLAVVDDVSTVLQKDRLTWSAIPFDENM